MSIQTGTPECSVSSLTEALAEVFARARELEALHPWDLFGLRMRQLVQIERARMDFEHFRKSLALELTNLQTFLSEALSVVVEASYMNEGQPWGGCDRVTLREDNEPFTEPERPCLSAKVGLGHGRGWDK